MAGPSRIITVNGLKAACLHYMIQRSPIEPLLDHLAGSTAASERTLGTAEETDGENDMKTGQAYPGPPCGCISLLPVSGQLGNVTNA